ncbi:MAG: transposase [Verrucomicrobiota bacterium]
MGRQIRIEFAGAIYHVMARGDRQEQIVDDDEDRRRFEQLWVEAIERSGWQVFAWVLMTNHYHAVIRTPEPNLVDGMRWVQNTWTKRYNARHQQWGHLFGGRYKAILCAEGQYLHALINYVHLNPVRAGLVKRTRPLYDFQWCSLADYSKGTTKRRKWVEASEGLKHMGFEDTATGRKKYLRGLEKLVNWDEKQAAGKTQIEGQSLQSTLKRGWYFGAQTFKEDLLKKLEKLKKSKSNRLRPVDGYVMGETKDYGIKQAQKILHEGLKYYDLKRNHLKDLKKGDPRKVVIATLIRQRTTISLGWISEQLWMGATPRISGAVSEMIRTGENKAEREVIIENVKIY